MPGACTAAAGPGRGGVRARDAARPGALPVRRGRWCVRSGGDRRTTRPSVRRDDLDLDVGSQVTNGCARDARRIQLIRSREESIYDCQAVMIKSTMPWLRGPGPGTRRLTTHRELQSCVRPWLVRTSPVVPLDEAERIKRKSRIPEEERGSDPLFLFLADDVSILRRGTLTFDKCGLAVSPGEYVPAPLVAARLIEPGNSSQQLARFVMLDWASLLLSARNVVPSS